MRATIQVEDDTATLENYIWTGDDALFVRMLNSMLDPLGPSGSDPAPNTHAAREIAERLGGEVLEFELPSYVPGRVY